MFLLITGLFQNVIAMSCGVTSNWIIKKDPLKYAKKIAKIFNCSTDSTDVIVRCLKNVPAEEITHKYSEMRVMLIKHLFYQKFENQNILLQH